jgi:outer membrane protein assembly factor BamB
LLVADIDAHTVHALDADSGEIQWSYTAGARIDSPPTLHADTAIFGSRDGWIYCLRASDGQLAWRYLAATSGNRIVSYGQLESTRPLHGSVLVQDGVVHAVAGRSAYLDGGMVLCRLDAATGRRLSETSITSAALPDILSSDGASVFLRHRRFDTKGVEQTGAVPHLYSPAGFLDDTWWHRTYWIYGTGMRSGWGSWPDSGNRVPAGRLLVADDSTIYGFGRFNQYHRDGSHVGLGRTRYMLYATTRPAAGAAISAKTQRRGAAGPVAARWNRPLPVLTRGMVMAGEALFVAGPPDVFTYAPEGATDRYHTVSDRVIGEQQAALGGKRGGLLMAISVADGRTLAEFKLDTFSVWDGIAAARGRLFLSAQDGSVMCFAGADGN